MFTPSWIFRIGERLSNKFPTHCLLTKLTRESWVIIRDIPSLIMNQTCKCWLQWFLNLSFSALRWKGGKEIHHSYLFISQNEGNSRFLFNKCHVQQILEHHATSHWHSIFLENYMLVAPKVIISKVHPPKLVIKTKCQTEVAWVLKQKGTFSQWSD